MPRRTSTATTLLAMAFALGLASTRPSARAMSDDITPEAAEFFEKEVRPLLVERCGECHGPAKRKGGLRLDSREAALAGGDSGPAVVPGDPGESLLVDAIRYGDLYQMPPKSKLPDAEIEVLTRWVAQGAPWPGTAAGGEAAGAGEFDFEARLGHWSFQPVAPAAPPAVADESWPRNEVDRFLLAALEEKGLRPSPEADRRTLVRRLGFDLLGLPPTPEEVEAFVADESPDAYEQLVERLLASPHYGERWGRHWLDLVRFAETFGHEFDYDIQAAYRYRDYVVRAFNDDLPYDRFVVEHLAGDLLDDPRRDPVDGSNLSALGTGFFWLGEGTHSPVDVLEEQWRRVDNQVDVLSKAFLGLTVACARCHDHKFDPIPQSDYYALAGYLLSSRHDHAFLDPPGRFEGPLRAVEAVDAEIRSAWTRAASAEGVAGRLLGAWRGGGSDPALAARWAEALGDERGRDPDHPLHAWHVLFGRREGEGRPDGDPAARRDRALARLAAGEAGSVSFEEFDGPGFPGWSVSGPAFGDGPSRPGDLRAGPDGAGPAAVAPGQAHSGLRSDRLQGVLRSRTFTIEHPFIDYRAMGRGGRIQLVIDGFEKVRAPIYGGLSIRVDADAPRWFRQDVSMWVGHDAYVELIDGGAVDFTQARAAYLPGDGYLAVDAIRFSGRPGPPRGEGRFARELLGGLAGPTPEALAARYEALLAGALADAVAGRGGVDPASAARAEALGWFGARGLLGPADDPATAALLARRREAESAIPGPTLGPAIAEATPRDAPLLVRGNHRNPGPAVPRRFLRALGGDDASPADPGLGSGSGRLDLARRVADPANPLTARVMVNRIWHHHFGAGLVATPDDFGAMGRPPTHPELLDWLADAFVRSGWSVKAMHRLMVLSSAYRMRSAPRPDAEAADPGNARLHRMNPRRLEAEAVRDAILAASGRLDRTVGGPSVPPHLTPFLDGRGRPDASGPLDGDGRRSLYLNVRRNFLDPMLLAFDFPAPATAMGRRNVSNVPAQALILLNDPFVAGQARHWADRTLADPGRTDAARVERLYLEAFARPPSEAERGRALAFLAGRGGDPQAWADLCHVLINVKEFLFIP